MRLQGVPEALGQLLSCCIDVLAGTLQPRFPCSTVTSCMIAHSTRCLTRRTSLSRADGRGSCRVADIGRGMGHVQSMMEDDLEELWLPPGLIWNIKSMMGHTGGYEATASPAMIKIIAEALPDNAHNADPDTTSACSNSTKARTAPPPPPSPFPQKIRRKDTQASLEEAQMHPVLHC